MSGQTGPSSPNEAAKLLQEYKRHPTDELATALIRYYEPMVKVAAGKLSRNRPDLYEDLLQIGQMALLQLFQRFDDELGGPFEPYAMKSMIGLMKNYMRDKSWYVQVPRRIKEKGVLLQQTVDELTVKLERSPKVEEIAEQLGLTVEETLELIAGRELYHYVSLDAPVAENGTTSTLGDLIGAPSDEFDAIERRTDLEKAFAGLKPEERKVLDLAYNEGLSQRAIAERLNVSQMSVSRILKRTTDKLRAMMRGGEP
jgi:RNA polymerase sigma-B factor